MERVLGLGGPFIKAQDPKALAAWYQKHLGITFHGTYAVLPFPEDEKGKAGYNLLSFFKSDADYFNPSTKDVMFNFIVADLFGLLKVLKEEGVDSVGEAQDGEYGKFGWVVDPEGNKIELWEPPVS